MKKIESLREIQKIEYDILVEFNKFCERNNIIYSLCAGTMLGAVRHKGFIPWDDDIDVMLMREEFTKLVECLKNNDCFVGPYKAYIPKVTKNYMYPFIKIVNTDTYAISSPNLKRKHDTGIWIDVFPIDYGYDDYNQCKRFIDKRLYLFKRVLVACGDYHPKLYLRIAKKIINFVDNLIGMGEEYWIDKVNDIPKNPPCKYAGVFAWPVSYGSIYQTDWFQDAINIKFEDHDFPCFKDYDNLLTSLFGDYMTLPPESERKAHALEAYWKE